MNRYDEVFSENWSLFEVMNIEEATYNIHVAWRTKIVYIEAPKVASTTMKRMLQQYEWGVAKPLAFSDVHTRRYSPLMNIYQVPSFQHLLTDPSFIKISMIRNPFIRVLSAYLDKIVLSRNSGIIANLLPYLDRHRHDMWADISFADFISAICRQPYSLMDLHWRPQYFQLYYNRISYDYIGKLEDIDEFIKYLEEHRPGISKFYEIDNSHITLSNEKIREYYTNSVAEAVRDKFALDFTTFAYDESLPRRVIDARDPPEFL